jgi:hypothetical protein
MLPLGQEHGHLLKFISVLFSPARTSTAVVALLHYPKTGIPPSIEYTSNSLSTLHHASSYSSRPPWTKEHAVLPYRELVHPPTYLLVSSRPTLSCIEPPES